MRKRERTIRAKRSFIDERLQLRAANQPDERIRQSDRDSRLLARNRSV